MDKRDDFQRLMKDCRRGKIDRIITKSISRFARNTKECLICIRELKELGITVMFEKENIDTASISDELMVTIMGGLAQEESTSISNNIKWTYYNQMQNGTIKLHSAPYGYTLTNGKLVINETEAVVIQDIFKMFLSGMGYKAICDQLNNMGIQKDEKGTKWLPAAIQYILTNEKYIGDSLWQKSYNISVPFCKKRNNGEKDKWYLKNTHTPIISHEDFAKAQELIELRKRPNRELIQSYPLTKKVFCGECGSTFRRKCFRDKVYWICRGHMDKAENCSIKQISEELFYTTFITMYNKLKCNYTVIFTPLLTQLQDLKNKKFADNNQYMELSKEIAKLQEQTHVIARLKTKGFLDESKYLEQSAEIKSKIDKLSREMRKIARCDDEDDVIEQIKEIGSIIENGPVLMANFDEVMFESLVEKIIVINQNELAFHLYGGLKFTEKMK